jgi:hypothetical protein
MGREFHLGWTWELQAKDDLLQLPESATSTHV